MKSIEKYDQFANAQLVNQYKAKVAKSPALQQWIQNSNNPLLKKLLPQEKETEPTITKEQLVQKEIDQEYQIKERQQIQEIHQQDELMESQQKGNKTLMLYGLLSLVALGGILGMILYIKSQEKQLAILQSELA